MFRKIRFIGLALVVTVTIITVWWWKSPTFNTQNYFSEQNLNLNTYDLFDVGIVDVNQDGNLDIFTTNHSAAQSMLVNNGQGKFTEVLSQWDLNQDVNLPGLEAALKGPVTDRPGLYIYRKDTWQSSPDDAYTALVIEAKGLENLEKIQGKITLASSVEGKTKDNVQVDIEENKLQSGATNTTIEFTVDGMGKLSLNHALVALPVSIELDSQLPLNFIYIGSQGLHPSSHSFTLHWRDRHGMAWADYNGDGNMDVFISRGGLRGQMINSPELFSGDFFHDELMTNTGEKFVNRTSTSGLAKRGCPGRQTAWVDVNNDQLLDLYLVCGKGKPPGDLVDNQLYQQLENGQFINVGKQYNIAHPERGSFAWLDTDLDGDMDLVWATTKEFHVYTNQGEKLKLTSTITNNRGRVDKLAIADFDSDGDFDIFTAQSRGTNLLINNQGTYTQTLPEDIGLPSEAITANWVDYDNDGFIDLHAVPSGLYRQLPSHQFVKTTILEYKRSLSSLDEARCAWFDFDNDGSLDVLIASKYRPWWVRIASSLPFLDIPDPRQWDAQIYHNIGSKNHWLEIDLVGVGTNPQALGTKVQITTPESLQLEQVGQADGSHYSQGHYRLYFGLGKHTQAETIKVLWSDGTIQSVTPPHKSGLLTISYPQETA